MREPARLPHPWASSCNPHPLRLQEPQQLPVIAAGLGDGVERAEGAVDQWEVHVHSGFDALSRDEQAGLARVEPAADLDEERSARRRNWAP